MQTAAISPVQRLSSILAAAWVGLLVAVGGMAAPSLFAVLDAATAGRVAGRLFAVEASASLVLSIVLFLLERQRTRRLAEQAGHSALSPEILLLLGALFCTALGHYALRPMMEAAKAGQGSWSFGALHAVSSTLFLTKGLLVLALSWRLSGRSGA